MSVTSLFQATSDSLIREDSGLLPFPQFPLTDVEGFPFLPLYRRNTGFLHHLDILLSLARPLPAQGSEKALALVISL